MFFCSFLPSDLTVSVWSHCSIKHGHGQRVSLQTDTLRLESLTQELHVWQTKRRRRVWAALLLTTQRFRRESKRRNTYKTCWKLLWNLNHKLHVEQLSHYSLIHTVAYCGREMDTKKSWWSQQWHLKCWEKTKQNLEISHMKIINPAKFLHLPGKINKIK